MADARLRQADKFQFHKVFVDITKVKLMSHAVRLVDKKDAEEKFKEPFLAGSYGVSGQYISIAAPGTPGWSSLAEDVAAHEGHDSFCTDSLFEDGQVIVVDGQHRHHVLNLAEVMEKVGVRQPVHLYTRKSGEEMDTLDALFLGNVLNYEAGQVRKMTAMDHVYSALSHVKVFIAGKETFNEETLRLITEVTSGTLGNASKALGSLLTLHGLTSYGQTQTRQYATIVCACQRMEGAYSVLESLLSVPVDGGRKGVMKTLTLNRLTPLALWDGVQSLQQLQFRLKAIIAWIGLPKRNESRASQNVTMTSFVLSVDGLFAFFGKAMVENGKDFQEVLHMKTSLSDWPTVEDYLTGQFRLWTESNRANFVISKHGTLPYIVRNTPELSDVAEKITRPMRNTKRPMREQTPALPARRSRATLRRRARWGKRATPLRRRKQKTVKKGSGSGTDSESGSESDSEYASSVERPAKRAKGSQYEEDGAEVASVLPFLSDKSPVPRSSPSSSAGSKVQTFTGSRWTASEPQPGVNSPDAVAGEARELSNSHSVSVLMVGTPDRTHSEECSGNADGAGDSGALDSVVELYDEEQAVVTAQVVAAPLCAEPEVARSPAAIDAESASEPAADQLLPFVMEGGPLGVFDRNFDSLPEAGEDGGDVVPEDFVQMRIAGAVGTIREERKNGTSVDDRYTDGFRIVSVTRNHLKYRLPDVRCGYRAVGCLLHSESDTIMVLEEGSDKWMQMFRDNVPNVFPFPSINTKYLDRAAFNWKQRNGDEVYPALKSLTDWEKLTSKMPLGDLTFSSRKPLVLDPFMWLRSLGVRPPHRSFFTLTDADLEIVHENVFLHANFAANGAKNVDNFGAGAVEGWFRSKRVELDEAGFVVFESFADDSLFEDENNVEVVGAFRLDMTRERLKRLTRNRVKKFLLHFERSIPSPQHILQGRLSSTSVWSTIINENDGRDGTVVGLARYTTTNFGLTWNLEQNKETAALVTARAELDVRILQIGKSLRLRYSSFDDLPGFPAASGQGDVAHPPSIYAPDTGGRFLATGPRCRTQVPHCDYTWYEEREEHSFEGLKHPGYFSIVTTSSPTPLWVARGSHRYIWQKAEMKKKIEEAMCMEKIIIPPWSIFFGRGDVTHAGAGYDEGIDADGSYNPLVRYHMYLVREDVPLLDAVGFQAALNPKSQK